jgi:hypothetical protein
MKGQTVYSSTWGIGAVWVKLNNELWSTKEANAAMATQILEVIINFIML